MKVELTRLNNAFHFQGKNEEGQTVSIDASPGMGGENLGVRPTQMLLMALAGCSGIDVVEILKKQKEPIDDLKIHVEAEREEGKTPSLFTQIHVKFVFRGMLNDKKVKRAIDLSFEKYCSVAFILRETAEITYDYEIKNS